MVINTHPIFSRLRYKFNCGYDDGNDDDLLYGALSCRRVLMAPKGNNGDHLSLYLTVVNTAALPSGWIRYAQFSLAVLNQIDDKFTVRKG